jgi:hypothetical protein
VKRRTTFAKEYGIKMKCNGTNVWEQIQEFGELDGNIMRTHWEPGKSEKKSNWKNEKNGLLQS